MADEMLSDPRMMTTTATPGGRPGMDRSRVNVLAAAVGVCGPTCIAAYKFWQLTGINVTVHCWFIDIDLELILSAQRTCKCTPHLAPHAGNFYYVKTGEVDALEEAMLAITTVRLLTPCTLGFTPCVHAVPALYAFH